MQHASPRGLAPRRSLFVPGLGRAGDASGCLRQWMVQLALRRGATPTQFECGGHERSEQDECADVEQHEWLLALNPAMFANAPIGSARAGPAGGRRASARGRRRAGHSR